MKPKLAATIVVRDEEDIIGPMIEHHVEQGVSHFLVTDNMSKDRTREILARYPEVKDVFESDNMTHIQEVHTTKMARLACALKPDWILHLDADEFWCNLEALSKCQDSVMFVTNAHIHPPPPGIKDGPLRLDKVRHYIDFQGKAPEFKIVHRPDPDIVVGHGNHLIVGREDAGYCSTLYRHHYPIRSYEQFERKVVQGTTALKTRGYVCQRWYKWHEDFQLGKLRETYDVMAAEWKRMLNHGIDDHLLKILLKSYGVPPQTADTIFSDLDQSTLRPLIREWIPNSYLKKKYLLA
jgi:hypothetical protein